MEIIATFSDNEFRPDRGRSRTARPFPPCAFVTVRSCLRLGRARTKYLVANAFRRTWAETREL